MVSKVKTVDDFESIRRMVKDCLESGRHHLDPNRSDALMEALDRCDLPAVHDLLVGGMIELKGVSYTMGVLQEIDEQVEHETPVRRVLH